METKTITIRVPLEHLDYLKNNPLGYNGAIVSCIEKCKMIEREEDKIVRGVFTPAEWKYLADVFRDAKVQGTFRFRTTILIANIEEYANHACYDKGVDIIALTDKAGELPSIGVDAVLRHIEDLRKNPGTDIDKWAEY